MHLPVLVENDAARRVPSTATQWNETRLWPCPGERVTVAQSMCLQTLRRRVACVLLQFQSQHEFVAAASFDPARQTTRDVFLAMGQ